MRHIRSAHACVVHYEQDFRFDRVAGKPIPSANDDFQGFERLCGRLIPTTYMVILALASRS